MGEHRDEVEALIHYCNIYAAAYRLEQMEFEGVCYSFAQIQVVEYLLEKAPMPGSRKELKIRVNALGRRLYEDYSLDILRWHFSPMFRSLDQIPPEYRGYICSALYDAMHSRYCGAGAGDPEIS